MSDDTRRPTITRTTSLFSGLRVTGTGQIGRTITGTRDPRSGQVIGPVSDPRVGRLTPYQQQAQASQVQQREKEA